MLKRSGHDQTGQHGDAKSFSCLTCRQRKVKCDRLAPCTQCARSARTCSFVPPVRGKPRGRKTKKEGLHAKLRRYEELLRSCGVWAEPSENDLASDDTASGADVDGGSDSRGDIDHPIDVFDASKTRIVTRDGLSRCFDTLR